MMMHKKHEHKIDILCRDCVKNACQRGNQGEYCWWPHTLQNSVVPDIESRLDFPKIPTNQTRLVGSQNSSQMKNQLMMNMMHMMTQFMHMVQ